MLRTAKKVDLHQYPTGNAKKCPNTIVTGDLHANPIRLLYFLIDNNVLKITAEDYKSFIQVYEKNFDNFSQDGIKTFKEILNKAKIKNKPKVLLIGDELGDRNHDYPILLILELLAKNKVPLEILVSNHGLEFIFAYEKYLQTKDFNAFNPTILVGHAPSLTRLGDLLLKRVIHIDEVMNIIETIYKPSLRFLSYNLIFPNGILVYSHAPTDLDTLNSLSKKLNVSYQDKTPLQLAQTIDDTNSAFQKYVQENRVTKLFDPKILYGFYEGKSYPAEQYPTEFTIWNRSYYLKNESIHNGFQVFYSHGHTREDYETPENQRQSNIYNLDTNLGKFPGSFNQDVYIDLRVPEFKPALYSKEEFQIKDFSKCSKNWGVCQLMGRAVVLMLSVDPVGYSAEQALEKKNIANISFSEKGELQIKIPLPENSKPEQVHRFAENFVIALETAKYKNSSWVKIDETSTYGNYKAQVNIDPKEIIRFVLQCGCSFSDLIDLVQNFKLTIDIEPFKQYLTIHRMLKDPLRSEAKYLGFIGRKTPESIEDMLTIYNTCRHLSADPIEIVYITLAKLRTYLPTAKENDSDAIKKLRIDMLLLLNMEPQLQLINKK